VGFLQQDTNNIIVDAVLTDLGRQKLAAGTFNVIKFAAGDDEVDYGMIVRYGRTVGQEKIEKNTPVFEAITNNKLALVHPLVSLPDPNRYTMPLLSLSATGGLTGDVLSLGVNSTTSTSPQQQSVTVQQNLTGGETVPQELVDNQFLVMCDDRFVYIAGSTPVIDRNRMATYVLTRNGAPSSQGGASVSIPITAKAITNAQFLIYGQPSNKSNIRTVVRVTGMASGAVKEFVASITK
jgi:hypothetical protein